MNKDTICNRFAMIFSLEELERITVNCEDETNVTVTVNMHQMKCKEGNRFIKNLISVIRISFYLIIIHGFNHGTKLKHMIMQECFSNRVCKKSSPSWNPGRTHMIIAA